MPEEDKAETETIDPGRGEDGAARPFGSKTAITAFDLI